MEAIIVTRQNFDYAQAYVVKDALWAADFENIFESNLANGEWTVVYTVVRGTKTFTYATTQSKFDERFAFTTKALPFLTMPITAK